MIDNWQNLSQEMLNHKLRKYKAWNQGRQQKACTYAGAHILGRSFLTGLVFQSGKYKAYGGFLKYLEYLLE